MKILKKLFLLSMTLILMVGLCGCMSVAERRLNTAEKFKNLALEYLNETYEYYDDTFTAKSYIGKDWATPYRTVYFTSEKYSSEINPDYSSVAVEIYDDDKGGYYFVDNYYQCYMYDEAVALLENIFVENSDVTDELLAIKISFPGYVYSDRFENITTFEDWRNAGTWFCDLSIYFIIQGILPNEDMEIIVQSIADSKIEGIISFITPTSDYLSSNNIYALSISEIMWDRYTNLESSTSFTINDDFTIEYR